MTALVVIIVIIAVIAVAVNQSNKNDQEYWRKREALEALVKESEYSPQRNIFFRGMRSDGKNWVLSTNAHYVGIDRTKRLVIIDQRVFTYGSIVNVELISGTQIVSSGGVGRAVVGAAIAGSTGAVVGATTAKRNVVNNPNGVRIYTASIACPAIELHGEPSQCQEVFAVLNAVIAQKTVADNIEEPKPLTAVPQVTAHNETNELNKTETISETCNQLPIDKSNATEIATAEEPKHEPVVEESAETIKQTTKRKLSSENIIGLTIVGILVGLLAIVLVTQGLVPSKVSAQIKETCASEAVGVPVADVKVISLDKSRYADGYKEANVELTVGRTITLEEYQQIYSAVFARIFHINGKNVQVCKLKVVDAKGNNFTKRYESYGTAPRGDSVAASSSYTMSDFKSYVETCMKSEPNLKGCYKIQTKGESLTIWLTFDGMAETMLYEQLSGSTKTHDSMDKSIKNLCITFYDIAVENGLDNCSVMVALLNDANTENTLLGYINGIKVSDFLD